MELDTKEKLLVAINYNNHSGTETFNYKGYDWENVGDVVSTDNAIKYNDKDDVFTIIERKHIITKMISASSYSSTYEEVKTTNYNFSELRDSAYWKDIQDRFGRYCSTYVLDNLKRYYVDIQETRMDLELPSRSNNGVCCIDYRKYDDYFCIYANGKEFAGSISDFIPISKDEYEELEQAHLILELVKENSIQILNNGYVYNHTYYDDIDDIINLESEDNGTIL